MEEGVNSGSGTCLYCRTFMHITFDEEKQEMSLETMDDYIKNNPNWNLFQLLCAEVRKC